jgi:outer membrane protein TolC
MNRVAAKILIFAFIFTNSPITLSIASASSNLTIEEYQKQVAAQNENYRAGTMLVQAYENRMFEGSTDFTPNLIGGFNYNNNKAVQIVPLYYGNDIYNESGNLGVQTKLRTGTVVNFGYSATYAATFGSSQFPSTPFYGASPALTLTQPLWKDFGARLSESNEAAVQANYKALILSQKFTNRQILFNSQAAYWRLSLTRELLQYDKDAIDRAQKNYNLTSKRAYMNIADRADTLQTLTALKARELQYQTDSESMRQASSTFNSLRGIQNDLVNETIGLLDRSAEEFIVKQVERDGDRFDTSAAQMTAQYQKQLAKLNLEKNKPDIKIFGTIQFNGRGTTLAAATGESWNPDNPTYIAGLQMSIPLDAGLIDHINQGYNASATASEMIARRAYFDLNQDWNDLKKHLKDAIQRLSMARELEKLQDEKLKHEKVRLSSGRTTSFQVLQFEDNFSDAQAIRLRIQNEIITMFAQAMLYNGGTL